jgi:hypothetical protein
LGAVRLCHGGGFVEPTRPQLHLFAVGKWHAARDYRDSCTFSRGF